MSALPNPFSVGDYVILTTRGEFGPMIDWTKEAALAIGQEFIVTLIDGGCIRITTMSNEIPNGKDYAYRHEHFHLNPTYHVVTSRFEPPENNPFLPGDHVILRQHGRFGEAQEYTKQVGLVVGSTYVVSELHPVRSNSAIRIEGYTTWFSHKHFEIDINYI